MTCLMWAAENGHEAVVRLLLEKEDVDINAKDNEGMTSLLQAVRCGKDAVARLLLKRVDIDINAKNKEGKTAIEVISEGQFRGWSELEDLLQSAVWSQNDKVKNTMS